MMALYLSLLLLPMIMRNQLSKSVSNVEDYWLIAANQQAARYVMFLIEECD